MNKAPPENVALFISDLHLQESMPHTTQAFFDFLSDRAIHAQQLYLLGDLFEYWAGDDDIGTPFHASIVQALRKTCEAGIAVFWIGGNRDFLIGSAFANASGVALLPDPHVVTIAGQRIVLTHGDAQCTDDHAYMTFRAQVRQTSWQQSFLAKPLAERKAIIENMRAGSRDAQKSKSYEIMDVNQDAIEALFDTADTSIMIHGHTHRPACHRYESHRKQRTRYVLPDWDYDTSQARGGWIGITGNGIIQRYGYDGIAIAG